MQEAIKEYVDAMKVHGIDTLLLSCTHYPFLHDEIAAAFGPQVTVLDPAEMTTDEAIKHLQTKDSSKQKGKDPWKFALRRILPVASGLLPVCLTWPMPDFT